MPSHTRDLSSSSTETAVGSPVDLPKGHPYIEPHYHTLGTICPILQAKRGDAHAYCPSQETDIRSVCPALNTMANHGYISRDGRDLSFVDIYSGLKACYGLSSLLAFILTLGGFLLIKRSPIRLPSWIPFFGKVKNPDGTVTPAGIVDLHLVGLHGGVEHDASVVHHDTPEGHLYPPNRIEESWVGNLVGDVQPPVHGYTPLSEEAVMKTQPFAWRSFATSRHIDTLVSAADVGRMRKRREQEILPKTLDSVHSEIARGEMAIVLGIWERTSPLENGTMKTGVPLPWLLTFLAEERLPEGGNWRPNHVQSLWGVVQRSKAIKTTQNGQ
ncbi:hypothetical protein D9758_005909 [Tetrapyrgos nigripes]|uniref:Heme haloperoxidase family profile domain-containing protein n=1 Tax=Tetrapyrgos nigripes TaxID=182062 RepID=A0A8H5G321_9AGAR|nr:hypothetical protein D9758_005909 [Tetrapyrgos nigripes]